jgi:hypothetical protein
MKAYIVRGKTGTYDNSISWPYKAYLSLKNAQHHMMMLNERFNMLVNSYQISEQKLGYIHYKKYHDNFEKFKEEMMQIDNKFEMDVNGTEYYMEECEFCSVILYGSEAYK